MAISSNASTAFPSRANAASTSSFTLMCWGYMESDRGAFAQALATEGSKACNRRVELRPLLG